GEHAWNLLGAMNAGRISTLNKHRAREWIRLAAYGELSEAYPVFALAIEGLVRRFANTDEVAATIRPMFEGIMLAIELAIRIGSRSATNVPALQAVAHGASTHILVRPGDRSAGIDFIFKWLRSTPAEILKVNDPYFGPSDLELLKLVKQHCPYCEIKILT